MRTSAQWIGGAAVCFVATTALAADHIDGPVVTTTPQADITDVYAWAPDDEKLAIIVNIGGLTAPGFSDSVQYVVHVGRGDVATDALLGAFPSQTHIICGRQPRSSPTRRAPSLPRRGR